MSRRFVPIGGNAPDRPNLMALPVTSCQSLEMDYELRHSLAREALDGFFDGPGASVQATAVALERAKTARSVVLVEGISDQIALETLASRLGRDLEAERVVIVPMGGAYEIARHLEGFGPRRDRLQIAGMCDAAEELLFRQSLEAAGFGSTRSRQDMERLGFSVCVDDLEQELIRASGREALESMLASQGDLGSFRTLQRQPAWRGHRFDDQIHRWLRAGARRSLRYARLLTLTIGLEELPLPFETVLSAVRPNTQVYSSDSLASTFLVDRVEQPQGASLE